MIAEPLAPFAGRLIETSDEGRLNLAVLVAGILLVAVGVWGLTRWQHYWKRLYERTWDSFPNHSRRWIAMYRAIYPFAYIPVTLMGGMITSGFMMQWVAGTVSLVSEVVVFIFFLLLVPTFLTLLSVVLFNRPQFVVPPHTRDFQGMLGDWVRWIWRSRIKKGRR